MDVRTEVTDAALRDLLAELGENARSGWCPARSSRMRSDRMTASFALSLENPAELLNLYIVRQLYNFPVDYWDRYTDRIMAVTPAQVQTVARKYLDPQTAADRRGGGRRRRSRRDSGRSARSRCSMTREGPASKGTGYRLPATS